MYRHTQVCLSVRECTGVCGSTRGCWTGDWGGCRDCDRSRDPQSPPSPPARSPPPAPARPLRHPSLPKGFIKTQRTETGTHGARRERGGVANGCRQLWQGATTATRPVSPHSRCPQPSSGCPSLLPTSPPPCALLPGQPRPRAAQGPAAGLAPDVALAQTPQGRRNGPWGEVGAARPRPGTPERPDPRRPPRTPTRGKNTRQKRSLSSPPARPTSPRQTLQVFNKKVQKMYTEMSPPGTAAAPAGSRCSKHT